MVGYLVVLVIVSLFGIRFVETNEDFLGKQQTTSIKGFFILLVFFSHIRGYLSTKIGIDYYYYNLTLSLIGQLMVTMFFFYSGYGVMESYRNKPNYLEHYLYNRVFLTWIHFILGLVAYVIINITLRIHYGITDYLFSVIGWTSIGNSNWYIFDILVLFLLSFLILHIGSNNRISKLWIIMLMFISTSLFLIVLKVAGKPAYWYNTLLCYPFGMLFSVLKEDLRKLLGNAKLYAIMLVLTGLFFAVSYIITYSSVVYVIRTLCFSSFIVILSYKLKVGNPILAWAGNYLFPLYLLQRIPMIIISHMFPQLADPVFTGICLCITVFIAWLFNKSFKYIDSVLRIII